MPVSLSSNLPNLELQMVEKADLGIPQDLGMLFDESEQPTDAGDMAQAAVAMPKAIANDGAGSGDAQNTASGVEAKPKPIQH